MISDTPVKGEVDMSYIHSHPVCLVCRVATMRGLSGNPLGYPCPSSCPLPQSHSSLDDLKPACEAPTNVGGLLLERPGKRLSTSHGFDPIVVDPHSNP